MQAGKLRHPLTIQARSTTRDSLGQELETWATVSTVWGSVVPLTGRELVQAQALHSETTHKVTVRFFDGLTTSHRMQHNGRTLQILSVLNTDERNREHVLMCKEWGT